MVTSSAGCFSYGNSSVIHDHVITGNTLISPEDQELCEITDAEPIRASVPAGGNMLGFQYQWQVKKGDSKEWEIISDDADDPNKYEPPKPNPNMKEDYGTKLYRRFVTSGCKSASDSVAVLFYKQPSEPDVLDKEITLFFTFATKLSATVPETGVGKWSSDDENLIFDSPDVPNTNVKNLKMGENTVNWTVSHGNCPSKSVQAIIQVDDVKIPNGFSPNGDRVNDCFRVLGGENAVTSELIIVDRYNNVVFESKKFNEGNSNLDDCTGWWDGRNKSGKELPSGTYFYQLILNGDKIYKGYVVLKRN
jgi:gliding motility-associated-like protein